MLKLGSWEYEAIRKQFVDDRRTNKEHQLWKPLWNGVSPSMWGSDEWYVYLEEKGGRDMLKQYPPQRRLKRKHHWRTSFDSSNWIGRVYR